LTIRWPLVVSRHRHILCSTPDLSVGVSHWRAKDWTAWRQGQRASQSRPRSISPALATASSPHLADVGALSLRPARRQSFSRLLLKKEINILENYIIIHYSI
jgi:hypothetical protein